MEKNSFSWEFEETQSSGNNLSYKSLSELTKNAETIKKELGIDIKTIPNQKKFRKIFRDKFTENLKNLKLIKSAPDSEIVRKFSCVLNNPLTLKNK
jgi:hypothetical protein